MPYKVNSMGKVIRIINLIFVFAILIFNILIPLKVYAVSVEKNLEIITDAQSSDEIIKFNNLYTLAQTSYHITQSSFYKINDLATRYYNNDIFLNDFKRLSNIEIGSIKLTIDNYLQARSLIPTSSKSKFQEIKTFYSNTQDYYNRYDAYITEQLQLTEKLIDHTVTINEKKYNEVLVNFLLNTADIHDFTADYNLLMKQIEPDETISSKLTILNIKVSRATAKLTRMSGLLTYHVNVGEVDRNKFKDLNLAIKGDLKRFNYFVDDLINFSLYLYEDLDSLKFNNSNNDLNELKNLLEKSILMSRRLGLTYTDLSLNIIEISNYTLDNYSKILINEEATNIYNNLFMQNSEITFKNQELAREMMKIYQMFSEKIQSIK